MNEPIEFGKKYFKVKNVSKQEILKQRRKTYSAFISQFSTERKLFISSGENCDTHLIPAKDVTLRQMYFIYSK